MLGTEYTVYIMSHALKVAFENIAKIWMYQPIKDQPMPADVGVSRATSLQSA